MLDYKELYLTMMRETEKAIRILINAQLKCEELYLNAGGTSELENLLSDEITDNN
jgi:hypothetical protein